KTLLSHKIFSSAKASPSHIWEGETPLSPKIFLGGRNSRRAQIFSSAGASLSQFGRAKLPLSP
ncbi:MAG: hypothetical protein N3B10_15455, partial [Armatimonadetes bacterium]|nr:hypothetical protein [Armatimonadota bacterium]